MKRTIITTALFSVLSMSAQADVLELAKEKECMSCHAIDKEMPKAPSFKDIANKYSDRFQVMLEHKVMSGGVGHWGSAPMPGVGARPAVSEDEATQLVAWILSLD